MPASSLGPSPRLRWAVPCALGLWLGVAAAPREAEATVVERIVAVVGDRAILLSDLRERARPFLLKIATEVPQGAQRAAAVSQLYKALIERMVDEELELKAATHSRVSVTAKEIDEAIARIAAQNRVKPEVVVQEAARSGLNERAYREEVRRQVLEAKLMNLRLQGRVRISDEDLRAAYREAVADDRQKLGYRVAWIVLDGGDGSARSREQAESISDQARHGADFATLARTHSTDATTRGSGGLLGWLRPGRLPAAVDRAARGLEIGEVSGAIRSGGKLVILKLLEREESTLPGFEEARDELAERVYLDKMGKARRAWLDGLRRRTHVQIRL